MIVFTRVALAFEYCKIYVRHFRACVFWHIVCVFFDPQEELYLNVGKMFALSILHGGQGPVFLAPAVIDYLFGGISNVKPCIDDIPDELVQSKLRKVCVCVLLIFTKLNVCMYSYTNTAFSC